MTKRKSPLCAGSTSFEFPGGREDSAKNPIQGCFRERTGAAKPLIWAASQSKFPNRPNRDLDRRMGSLIR
jgi:hypothetical protein